MSGAKLWEGLWRSDKTQLQTGPRLRTRMWYFHVGRPTAAWHTPLWSMWRGVGWGGIVMHSFCTADTVWEWMSGQSQRRVSEPPHEPPSSQHTPKAHRQVHQPPAPTHGDDRCLAANRWKMAASNTHTDESAQLGKCRFATYIIVKTPAIAFHSQNIPIIPPYTVYALI